MKISKLLPTAACLCALALVSCGGGKKAATAADSDSTLTAEMESPVAGEVNYFLTPDSIGPVRVGEGISDLPPVVANLYDNMIVTETPDAMAYTFMLADVPQFTVYDFMEGNVDVIALEGDSRGVQVPGGQLRVGDEFSKVLRLPGVQSEWAGFDAEGVWYWNWNGLYFSVDETGLPEKMSAALCNQRTAPRLNDFTPEMKIGYIGTGLPF